MKNKINKFIFWTPRILAIIFILFLAIFSFDVFDNTSGFFKILLALLIHNIPSLFLLIVLIISWKHELVGGIFFTLAGFLYIISCVIKVFQSSFHWYFLLWILMISVPAFLVGILFLICWRKKKKSVY